MTIITRYSTIASSIANCHLTIVIRHLFFINLLKVREKESTGEREGAREREREASETERERKILRHRDSERERF